MSDDLNPNIDSRIRFKLLPPATIIKDFVIGEADCMRLSQVLE